MRHQLSGKKAEVKLVPIKALIGSSIRESFTLDLRGGNSKSFSMFLKDLNIS